jgi:methylmalonyl-CoA mutase N-terminal domain/subunit
MSEKAQSVDLEEAFGLWEDSAYKKTVERHKERKASFGTLSGIPIEPVYTPLHVQDQDYSEDLGFPGQYPFTRGVQPTMYRGRLWTMRQYAGFGTAEETNARFKYLLEQGQTGLSVAFDLPTQLGYDSDDPLAEGEVGKVGVAISSLADMEVLFDGIPLDKVSTSMTINAPAAVLLAMYISCAEKQGVDQRVLSGTIQNDILKEYVARGNYIFPPEPSMRLIVDTFGYCSKALPEWNTISVSGYHIREAGATAVQEVAFTLANGIEYVRAAIRAGLDVDDFAPRISFFFNAHSDFFEEIAKFRAARRLWGRIMKEKFKAKKPRSLALRFHTQTGGSTLTAQQPDNNIVRVTLQALSAVLGGTQSLHTNSRDEALALPGEDAVRIALRTQQVIAFESQVADVIDPLGGSYFVEALTDEVEKRAVEYIEKIEAMGGATKAIESGYISREIHESAYRYQKEVEKNDRIVVGVNAFTVEEETPFETLKVDSSVERFQVERLRRIKERRDDAQVRICLERLKKDATEETNLMPAILECVKCYSTLGEICNTLRDVFGEYRPGEGF